MSEPTIEIDPMTTREAAVLVWALELAREMSHYRSGYRQLEGEIHGLYLKTHHRVYGDNSDVMLAAAWRRTEHRTRYGNCSGAFCGERFTLDENGLVPSHENISIHDCEGSDKPPR